MKIKTSKTLMALVTGMASLAAASAGTYKHINIDGSFADWAAIAPAYTVATPGSTTSVAYKDIYVANDEDFLYIRFTIFVAGDPFTSHENIFIDADANLATGFQAAQGRVGSEMLIQGATGYQEKNGGFNEGGIDNLAWASAPAAPGTDFEMRISRKALFNLDQSSVFVGDNIAFLLEAEDSGFTPVEFAPFDTGGLAYTFEGPPPVLTTNVTLLDLSTNSWQVNASGTNLGTTWLDQSYDDTQTGWTAGLGLFGYSSNPGVYPPINTALATGPNTYYFRTRFQWSFDATNVVLIATNYLSDGAVYYINGAEVQRLRMPSGIIGYDTNATGAVSTPGTAELLAFSTAPLGTGENILEVETHQAPGTSQDMVFGLSLTAAAQFPVTILDATQPADRSVVAGESTTFSANLVGSGPLSYQWFKDGAAISNATSATLTIPVVLTGDAGAFALQVSNPISTNTSRAAILTVTGTPVVLTDLAQPADQTVVEGNPVTFQVAASGSAPLQYQWFKGNTSIPDATNAAYSIDFVHQSDAGSYHAVVTNPLSSTNSRSAILTVTADSTPPTLTAIQGTPSQVTVTFSEPVDPVTAGALTNYTIDGGLQVLSATPVTNNQSRVTLTTSPQTLGHVYAVTIIRVQDLFGNPIAPNSQKTFLSSVIIDGTFDDWAGVTPIYTGESNNPTVTNFKDIYVYNDANYIYLRVTTWDPTVLPIFYNNFFFDTDNDSTTGNLGWGGAEMLIQGGAGYQEKNGGFNEGDINGLDWSCEPAVEAMDFELRFSRGATYASDSQPVFTTNVINFIFDAENSSFQSVNRAPATGSLSYTLVETQPQPPGPLNIGYSGGQVQVLWTGPGTLQAIGSLSSQNWTNVPGATSPYTITTPTGQLFFRLSSQ
jgi:Immunoglobulin domain/Immunoglobulin I-set domain/Bacterial Ig-like domain